jgi:uncharacterized protein DUF3352
MTDRNDRPEAETPAPGTTASGAPDWAPTTTYSAQEGTPATTWAPPPASPPPDEPVVRRTSRGRWIVAFLASGLVVAILVGLVIFAGGPAPSGAPAYLPGNTFLYSEARLDLPGSQRQKMVQFLSHFPGFKDQASFDRKIDETLDRYARQATNGRYSYTGDVKPWFGGQVALALTALPQTGATNTAPAVIALSVTDRAKAEATLNRLREDAKAAGVTLKSEEYRGVTIWSVDAAAPRPAGMPMSAEYALTSDTLLLSAQPGAIKASLDRKQGSGDSLARSGDFAEGLKGIRDDRIALIYIGTRALKASIEQQLGAAPGSQVLRDTLKNIPDQFSGSARVESDRLILETRSKVASGQAPALRESALASRVPASSLVFLETQAVGQGIGRLITQLKGDPQLKAAVPQLEQVELALGNKLESYLDWIGDVAVAGEAQNGRPTGGLVATVSSEDVAKQRLGQLIQLVRLGGTQAGGQVAVSEEQHGGITITKIAIATDGTIDIGGQKIEDIEVAFAFKQGLFVLGTPDYVRRILDLPAGQGLAGSQRFKDALAAAGGPRTVGIGYVDLAGLRTAAEGLLPPAGRTRYDQEYKPYLEPLDLMVSASVAEGDTLVNRAILIVK